MIKFKKTYNSIFFCKSLIGILLFMCIGNTVLAQNIPVPENIQAALLSKVLQFNTNIAQKETIKMLVVYDDESNLSKDKFINGLEKFIEVKAVKPIELEQNIVNNNVVYFMSGLQDKKYTTLCKTHNTLSVTGAIEFVEKGEISLGFGLENNKPKILVNLTSLEKEEQAFSSEILRISKIFK